MTHPGEPREKSAHPADDGLDSTGPATLPEEDLVRNALLVAVLFAVACPVAARADVTLQHPVFTDAAPAPRAHLVPPLRLAPLAADTGSGAGGGTEPALALVLGIFPGFGLGHYVAGAAWQNWALIDGLLLIAAIVVTAADLGVLVPLAWIATVVERVIEGLDAYHHAGGGKIAARVSPRDLAVAVGSSPPVREAGEPGPSRPPEVVLARF